VLKENEVFGQRAQLPKYSISISHNVHTVKPVLVWGEERGQNHTAASILRVVWHGTSTLMLSGL